MPLTQADLRKDFNDTKWVVLEMCGDFVNCIIREYGMPHKPQQTISISEVEQWHYIATCFDLIPPQRPSRSNP